MRRGFIRGEYKGDSGSGDDNFATGMEWGGAGAPEMGDRRWKMGGEWARGGAEGEETQRVR